MITVVPCKYNRHGSVVHPVASLPCARAHSNKLQVSLEGARYAVAWSGSGCGFGFDLVWASGRTWSFLCEDSFNTNSWVRGDFRL